MLLAEGATAGSGLFLQGIPSVSHFVSHLMLCGPRSRPCLEFHLRRLSLGHSCGGGKVLELQGDGYNHLHHCSQQGRAYTTNDAVLEQLRAMLQGAELGYGWRVERNP